MINEANRQAHQGSRWSLRCQQTEGRRGWVHIPSGLLFEDNPYTYDTHRGPCGGELFMHAALSAPIEIGVQDPVLKVASHIQVTVLRMHK